METKSRYEIIADLENKKAGLITAQASLGMREKQLEREVEVAKENLKEFLDGKDINERNMADQLASLNKSLERFDTQKTK